MINMNLKASDIAQIIGGEVVGNGDVIVDKVSRIEEGVPASVSFLANPKYTSYIYQSNASVIIVGKNFKPERPVSATLIRVDDPYTAFARLLDFFNKNQPTRTGISEQAYISPSATIGKEVYIGPFAYIGDHAVIGDKVKVYPQVYIGDRCKIGEETTIHPGVKIYSDCIVGRNCIIHAGVVIGADGFGFAPQQDNQYMKISQIGNVIVEDDVEIGANTTIDRATLGSTIIRKGVKLDNLIQIAHNVELGENTVMAAQSGIAGSTKIGKNCLIAAQAGIVGHLKIGNNVKVAGQAGVSHNLPDSSVVMGSPAFEASRYKKSFIHFRNLHDIVSRLEHLEKKLNELNSNSSQI